MEGLIFEINTSIIDIDEGNLIIKLVEGNLVEFYMH